MWKKKQAARGSKTASNTDEEGPKLDLKSIMKDVEFLSSAHMTWKERKELENRKVVSLGGKPPKQHRLPLSVARVQMKKQKEREQKALQESLILGRFGGNHGNSSRKQQVDKRRPEDRVLKSTGGHFKNGVLDVKHLLRPSTPKRVDNRIDSSHAFGDGKKKKGGKKSRGKKGGRKRH